MIMILKQLKAIEKYWIEYAHFCDKQFEKIWSKRAEISDLGVVKRT